MAEPGSLVFQTQSKHDDEGKHDTSPPSALFSGALFAESSDRALQTSDTGETAVMMASAGMETVEELNVQFRSHQSGGLTQTIPNWSYSPDTSPGAHTYDRPPRPASPEEHRDMMGYLKALNERLERDAIDRQSELQSVITQINQLRNEFSHSHAPRLRTDLPHSAHQRESPRSASMPQELSPISKGDDIIVAPSDHESQGSYADQSEHHAENKNNGTLSGRPSEPNVPNLPGLHNTTDGYRPPRHNDRKPNTPRIPLPSALKPSKAMSDAADQLSYDSSARGQRRRSLSLRFRDPESSDIHPPFTYQPQNPTSVYDEDIIPQTRDSYIPFRLPSPRDFEPPSPALKTAPPIPDFSNGVLPPSSIRGQHIHRRSRSLRFREPESPDIHIIPDSDSEASTHISDTAPSQGHPPVVTPVPTPHGSSTSLPYSTWENKSETTLVSDTYVSNRRSRAPSHASSVYTTPSTASDAPYRSTAAAIGLNSSGVHHFAPKTYWEPDWSSFPLEIYRGAEVIRITIKPDWDDELLVRELSKTYDRLRSWKRFLSLRTFRSMTDVWAGSRHAYPQFARSNPENTSSVLKGLRIRHYFRHPELLRDETELMQYITRDRRYGVMFMERWDPYRITFAISAPVTAITVFTILLAYFRDNISDAFLIGTYMITAYSTFLVLIGILSWAEF